MMNVEDAAKNPPIAELDAILQCLDGRDVKDILFTLSLCIGAVLEQCPLESQAPLRGSVFELINAYGEGRAPNFEPFLPKQ